MDNNITEFDYQSLYTSKIEPLLAEMKIICKLNKIPFFFAIATKNINGKTTYKNDGVLTGSNEIGLYDDMFERFLMVMHGANVNYIPEFDEEALGYIMNELQEETPDTGENDTNDNISFYGDL